MERERERSTTEDHPCPSNLKTTRTKDSIRVNKRGKVSNIMKAKREIIHRH